MSKASRSFAPSSRWALSMLGVRPRLHELLELRVAGCEPARIHALWRPHGQRRLLGIGQVHRPVFAAEEAGRGEGLDLLVLADAFQSLTDVDECWHHRIPRSQRAAHPGADVRAGHGLRRYVTGMPVILVAGMQDRAEVGLHVGADERGPIEHLRDLGQAIHDAAAVDRGGDRGKRADHVGHGEAGLEGFVLLRIERVGSGHAAGHPEHDHRIGGRRGMRDRRAVAGSGAWLREAERRRRGGGQALEVVAASEHGVAPSGICWM